jgi:hypothetical protein
VPPDKARGRPAGNGNGLQDMSPAPTIQAGAGLLRQAVELISGQGDRERAAYDRGFNDGRATTCVALAEMEHRREAVAWWREWAAKLARIIQNNDDPSVRLNQVLREISADQQFMREARRKRATKPGALSPLEACALRRIRLADPGDPL